VADIISRRPDYKTSEPIALANMITINTMKKKSVIFSLINEAVSRYNEDPVTKIILLS